MMISGQGSVAGPYCRTSPTTPTIFMGFKESKPQ
jgi:hypothetical protein